jgi:hypothetical protein
VLEDVGNVAAWVASDKARTLTSTEVNISCGALGGRIGCLIWFESGIDPPDGIPAGLRTSAGVFLHH